MDAIETIKERNNHFAAHQFPGELAMMPALKTMIIGCADPRVDPGDVLGLELGDTPTVSRDLSPPMGFPIRSMSSRTDRIAWTTLAASWIGEMINDRLIPAQA
jgi:hypothetical protein